MQPDGLGHGNGGVRLEGYLKKKNPHGITWYKRRWAVLDPSTGTLSFFKERWQSQLGFALRTVDVRGYQLCDDQLGKPEQRCGPSRPEWRPGRV